MSKRLVLVAVVLTFGWVSAAWAVPITYLGTLQPGVPVSDFVAIAPLGGVEATLTDFWQFTLTETRTVTITGHRLEAGLDPAFFLLPGTFTDTDNFGGDFHLVDLAFADDDIPEPPGLEGPFSDPLFQGQLAAGTYTVAFGSNGSDPGGPYPYCLELDGPAFPCQTTSVPGPAPVVLLALGLGISALVPMVARRR